MGGSGDVDFFVNDSPPFLDFIISLIMGKRFYVIKVSGLDKELLESQHSGQAAALSSVTSTSKISFIVSIPGGQDSLGGLIFE